MPKPQITVKAKLAGDNSKIEILVDGKPLTESALLIQKFATGMDAEKNLPWVQIEFIADQVEVETITDLFKEKAGR